VGSVSAWGDGLRAVPVRKPVSFFITAPQAQLKDIGAKVIGESISISDAAYFVTFLHLIHAFS